MEWSYQIYRIEFSAIQSCKSFDQSQDFTSRQIKAFKNIQDT